VKRDRWFPGVSAATDKKVVCLQILRSLSLLGCKEHAKAFLGELRRVYATNSEGIGYDILEHWRYAATDLNKPEH
jgi:hypothetical protein